ncbi:aminotransferase class V-fold PLP-dependent enzyme [Algoriphagus boritolerans]|uniref:Selenocysteine lyase/Cysteine desulfurase n=2 Tax=Algoriphagus TaxID=246875 RepID=A0A1H5XN43_9BACT|nr:aminotransferase class V-fold PLP-dependent enzyme [Algoriphagus boritolerans]SEG12790.1 Selenocysteine lyase/Cysteine desulfurase [Algoriphagus boritolerans DSM 17298 = JCM 18970]
MNKRSFLKSLAALGIGTGAIFESKAKPLSWKNLDFGSADVWDQIRNGYRIKPDYINLENGYYCFLPEETLEKYIEHIREVNYQASFYMRGVQVENKAKSAAMLAELVGASSEEVVLTRNTTESLDLIISGYPWKAGDEAVFAYQDYGSMQTMFELASKRWGIKTVKVNIPMHPENDEEIVEVYRKAITPDTRLIMVPHIVNITGHILPVRKIAAMAHERGVEIMLDGAHAVGHFTFKMHELDCDYYGSSLHKWLSVPLGAGMLYVKKEKISKIQPLLAPFDMNLKTIGYLNHIGTHPVATDLAVINAIEFQNKIGAKRKEERLRFLQKYWSDQVRNHPGIQVNTPIADDRCCGIGNVWVERFAPAEMGKTLMEKYKIFTAPIDGAGVRGVRVSPNIYTSTAELDQLVKALKEMAG